MYAVYLHLNTSCGKLMRLPDVYLMPSTNEPPGIETTLKLFKLRNKFKFSVWLTSRGN
jgi:hypothetical protein